MYIAALAQIPLKVLADGPLRPGLIEIGRTFYRDSGQQVHYVFGASPNILARVEAGEAADVLIVQPDHLADLVKSGKVVAGEHPVIGRVGLGLAARADAPGLGRSCDRHPGGGIVLVTLNVCG